MGGGGGGGASAEGIDPVRVPFQQPIKSCFRNWGNFFGWPVLEVFETVHRQL